MRLILKFKNYENRFGSLNFYYYFYIKFKRIKDMTLIIGILNIIRRKPDIINHKDFWLLSAMMIDIIILIIILSILVQS